MRGRLLACLVFFGPGARAGQLAVDPVRLDLSTQAPVAALTVRNAGAEPVLMQLEPLAWSQQDGEDRYTASDDLLATPPIFTVPPGGGQIVRVGLRRPVNSLSEQSYRLFLQEQPRPAAAPSEPSVSLRTILRIGVPVFVAPAAPARADLRWRATRTGEGLRVEATNTGNVHAKLIGLDVSAPVDDKKLNVFEGLAYVLPGNSRHWLVQAGEFSQGERLRLWARTERETLKAGLEVQGP